MQHHNETGEFLGDRGLLDGLVEKEQESMNTVVSSTVGMSKESSAEMARTILKQHKELLQHPAMQATR
jgi:hypothetical protein